MLQNAYLWRLLCSDRCMSDNTTLLCKTLPKVKKSRRDHFKSGNNFPTEVLRKYFKFNCLLTPRFFLLVFRLTNRSVWNSRTPFNSIQMKSDMPLKISLEKRDKSTQPVSVSNFHSVHPYNPKQQVMENREATVINR